MGDDSSLPRSGDDLRVVLGDRRIVATLTVVLVVLVGGLWGLAVYQPAPTTPLTPPFVVADPPAPVDGSYRLTSQFHATAAGETLIAERTRTYVPSDPPVALGRWTFGGIDNRTTVVFYQRGNQSYSRQTWASPAKFRVQRSIQPGDDQYSQPVNATQTVYTVERHDRGVDSAPTGSLALEALGRLPYERSGTTTYRGRTVVRYLPQTGWVTRERHHQTGTRTVRVRSASGEVLVGPETGAVLAADVEASLVEANTWGEVLIKPDIDISVHYRVVTDVTRPAAPPWVDAVRERANETATAPS